MYSNMLIFAFVAYAFAVTPNKSMSRLMSRNSFPMFSSGSVTVSGLMFKSLIHLELISIVGIR